MKNIRLRAVAFPALVILLALGLIALAGCGKKAGGREKHGGPTAVPVTVTSVKLGTVEKTVPITGNLEALQDVSLAARVTARVIAVNVREGDAVRAGQVLVQQDTSDLEQTVRQAQANVQNLQAQLAQAYTNYQIEVNQARQAVLKDQDGVAAAKYNYSKVKQGNRPQQILQSQTGVQQAKANLDNAAITLKRNQALFQQGAVARSALDTAQTTYDVDLQLYNNAQASLSLTKAGNYPQDIAYAAEQTKEAQATLQNDIANLQTITVRKQQIQAAQAAVTQAQATVAYDQQQVTYATITSPIDGIVATRSAEPGEIASTSASVMRVVNVRTMYYEPTVSETDLAQTSVGDRVQVSVDAVPGKTYAGKVVAIYPAASTTNRVFTLRVNTDDPNYELRPGMFARGSLITQVHRNVVVVPVAALVPLQSSLDAEAGQGSNGVATGGTTLPSQQVFLVGANDKAVAQTVNLGIITTTTAEVTNGLRPGDPLITTGQDQVQAGQAVSVVGRGGHRHGGGQSNVAALPGN